MIVARTGDVVAATCVCLKPLETPYPIVGVIGAGFSQFTSGGIPIALGALTIVNFICTIGPQTGLIVSTSVNNAAGFGFARMGDPVIGPCIVNGLVTSATSTINSM